MGWWYQTMEQQGVFAPNGDLAWGDEPADILTGAVQRIADAFVKKWNRRPTKDELRAGLEFEINAYSEASIDKKKAEQRRRIV